MLKLKISNNKTAGYHQRAEGQDHLREPMNTWGTTGRGTLEEIMVMRGTVSQVTRKPPSRSRKGDSMSGATSTLLKPDKRESMDRNQGEGTHDKEKRFNFDSR